MRNIKKVNELVPQVPAQGIDRYKGGDSSAVLQYDLGCTSCTMKLTIAVPDTSISRLFAEQIHFLPTVNTITCPGGFLLVLNSGQI